MVAWLIVAAQLNVLQAEQPGGEQREALDLPRHALDVAGGPQVNVGHVLAHLLPDLGLQRAGGRLSRWPPAPDPTNRPPRVGIVRDVQRAAAVQDAPGVAVGVQQARPTAQRELVVALVDGGHDSADIFVPGYRAKPASAAMACITSPACSVCGVL